MSQNNYDTIGRLIEQINERPIIDIIKLRMQPVNGNGDFLCPFHDDHKANNFKITKDGLHYKCYACDAFGNAINFIKEYDNISFKSSVIKIALELGYISRTEAYTLLTNGNPNNVKMSIKSNSSNRIIKIDDLKSVNNIGTPEELNSIYEIFRLGYSLIGKDILTKEHRQELKDIRYLSDEDIERDQYFTFPDNSIMPALLMEMKKRGIDAKVLEKIPGFYYSLVRNKWAFTNLTNTSGVGIPIKDYYGNIVGIQIRLDKVSDKAKRYQWFSSSFANSTGKSDSKSKNIHGTSPGSPIAVIKPQKNAGYNKTVFITEGFFKARKLTEVYGCYSLSVQGVTNWKHIVNSINDLIKSNVEIKCVYIAFDADMCRKDTVIKPALKMAFHLTTLQFSDEQMEYIEKILKSSNRSEKERVGVYENEFNELKQVLIDKENEFPFKIKFLLWDESMGKGVDDLLNNDEHLAPEFRGMYKNTMGALDFYVFWECAFRMLAAIDEKRLETSKETNEEFRKIVVDEDIRVKLYKQYIVEELNKKKEEERTKANTKQ